MSNVTIVYKTPQTKAPVKLESIQEGTFFTGRIGSSTARLFLRAYDVLIALDEPGETWSLNRTNSFALKVQDYVPVDIKITVTKKEIET